MNKVTFPSINPIKNLCTLFWSDNYFLLYLNKNVYTTKKNYALYDIMYKTLDEYCLVDIFRKIANTFMKLSNSENSFCHSAEKLEKFRENRKKLFKNDLFEFGMNLGF